MKPKVARIWRGRTSASRAEEYMRYMYEHGVKQVFRRVRNGVAEF